MSTGTVIHDARFAGAPEQPVDLVLEGGTICEIRTDTVASGGMTVIDAHGAVVFPGLVDSHVHLAFAPHVSPEFELGGLSDQELVDRIRIHAMQHLEAGVTSVRDLGGPGEPLRTFAASVESGAAGPRVWMSGPVITRSHGHCYFIGDLVGDVSDISGLVDGHADAGDGWIKVMVTGGALTSTSRPEDLQFDVDTMRTVVNRAHDRGLRVAAHVLTGEGARVAVEAGVDSIEHGVGTDRETLDQFAERNGTFVPVLSPSDLTLARAGDDTAEHVSRLRAIVGVLHDTVRSGIQAGVAFAAGSDSGCPDVVHGAGMLHELRLLERLGLPRDLVLAAATTVPSALLDDPRIGRLVPGAYADMLLLAGDPLNRLDALEQPRLVMAAGRVVFDRRDELSKHSESERNPG